MDFSKPWKNSDQILIVEGREMHVHRCMLSLWSPVFDRMFNSNFKEKNCTKIELKMKSAGEIEEMLNIMYDRSKHITESNFQYLFELSEEYQIEQLRHQCVEYIKQVDKAGLKSLIYLVTADRFGIKDVVETCIKELASVSTINTEMDDINKAISDQLKNKILSARIRQLEDETKKLTHMMESLTKYLYGRANEAYINFLREQGLEETVLSRCTLYDEHVDKRIGQTFDIDCTACRKNSMLPKTFTVESKKVGYIMEQMYKSTDNVKVAESLLKQETNSKPK